MNEVKPSQLTPINLEEERQAFFESDTYQPQFRYSSEILPEWLTIWGTAKPFLAEHADKMLKVLPVSPLKSSDDITEEVITKRIAQFNDHYQLETPVEVRFSATQLSKCAIDKNIISFRTPLRMDDEKLEALVRHELETHALRYMNHLQQPWKDYISPAPGFRRAEEGLATLHTFLFRSNLAMRKSFLSYAAAAQAEHASFREVYDYLRSVGCPKSTSWKVTVRVKRGYQDTSLPGAFTRELCYLEGTVQVWQALMNKDVTIQDLYLGRISIEDVAKLGPTANRQVTKVPGFASGDHQPAYFQQLAQIGTVNQFDQLPKL